MLIVPVESPDHTEDALLIVLDDANLARMAVADPAEVVLRDSGRMLVNPTVLVCHQNSTPEFARLLQARNFGAIVKYLQRGWQFRPDKGDHDRGPESITSQQ